MAFRGVLPEIPSFSAQLGRNLGAGLTKGIASRAEMAQKLALQKAKSGDLATMLRGSQDGNESEMGFKPFSPQQEAQLAIEHPTAFKAYEVLKGDYEKKAEKQKTFTDAMDTIEEMRKYIPSAGPTNYVAGLFGGETTKNRAHLQTLGRSLIPLVATGIPIKNQREFNEYSKIITDPNSKQAELEGALDGIESLITGKLEGSSKSSSKKRKFSSENPEHRKKAEQLYKTFGDKEKVREALSREFEF